MSFKRGNIVKIKEAFHPWDDSDVGKLAVIEYSYGEKYGNGECYGGYFIIKQDDGSSSAWWDEHKLEFVSDGGEEEIKKCKLRYEEITNKEKDLEYIKNKILNKEYNLSSISIIKLFEEIGFESSFLVNGEYLALFRDWVLFSELFINIFNKEYDKMINFINNRIKEEKREEFKEKVIKLYNKVNE